MTRSADVKRDETGTNMQHIHYRGQALALCLFVCFCFSAKAEVFTKPDIIEDNVAFWKKIYSEVPLNKGLLHDHEYPMVIYGEYEIGEREGEERRQYIRAIRKPIEESIKRIKSSPKEKWTDLDRKIAQLFQDHGEEGALDDAIARIRFQNGQKERFMEGLRLSGMYLDTIRFILRKFDVPEKLAYLPHVESSFLPNAMSHAGAAGMWQFMRGTGREYLAINDYVDERLDPIYSTYAAAEMLAGNFTQVENWPLAITGYNYGINGIRRAVSTLGSNDFETVLMKHSSRTFKFSSRNFYACFIAASDIAENPEEYFDEIDFRPKREFRELVLEHWIKPSVLAKYLGMDIETMRLINPAVRSRVFNEDLMIPKGTRIRVPSELTEAEVAYAVERIPAADKSSAPPVITYRVRRGDTLSRIAARHGSSISSIMGFNNIRRPDRIYIGQVLKIPRN